MRLMDRFGRPTQRIHASGVLGIAAAVLLTIVASASVTAQAQADAVRAEMGKPMQQARDLIKAQKFKDALVKLREIDALPNRSAYENFVLEQMRASAALSAGDNDQAIHSMEALITSGRLPEADQSRYAANIAGLYYRAKDYNNAATWAARALKGNPGDSATRALMIQSYFLGGDLAAASREALADIQAAEKAGQTPPEDKLQLLANIAARNGGDRSAYMAAIERLVMYYPKREYWSDLLRRLESKTGFSQRLTLDLYRLRVATKTLDSANDILEMAQLALQEQQAAEAKKVLDDGFASGVLGKGTDAERQKRLLALANQRAADAVKELQASEAEANASKDGSALVRIGFAYTGLGQYDKGLAMMQQGIAKGGIKRVDEAHLHLGIAYIRVGQKARAAQALRAVGGTDGAADLARLWLHVPGAVS